MGANSLDIPRPMSRGSTLAGSPMGTIKEKSEAASTHDSDDATVRDEKDVEVADEPTEPDAEYPSGFKMLFIVVALVLSVFLLSLDMVSRPVAHVVLTS